MSAVATLVFCAPGYPGAPGDAQPYVEKFANAAAGAAGWSAGSLAAAYDPTEQGGLKALGNPDSVLTFVPYAFYVQYGAQLHLAPLAQANVVDVGTQERWTLGGKAGGPSDAAALAGYTIVSVAGYAPEFVRHSALKSWTLPADVKIEASGQVLSTLRRVMSADKVVALLDQTQAAVLVLQTQIEVDKTAIVHTLVGKANFEENALAENINTLIDAIVRAKPAAAKGTYLRSITIASTMGPGVKIDPTRVKATAATA